MEKAELSYDNFLFDVPLAQRPFVDQVNELLQANGCTVKLQMAKNGYVVSYTHKKSKRVIANFIFRKQGLLIRIYGDQSGKYLPFLDQLPDGMKKEMETAAICRRLHDPTKCNARCPLGNVFTLNGTEHKKCRYDSFVFFIDGETAPHVLAFLEKELEGRAA